MGPREGTLVAVLLLAAGCGKTDPPAEPWWRSKSTRDVVDRGAPAGDDSAPASEGYRTLSWRIGSGDPLRFTIVWIDARTEGPAIARIEGRIEEGMRTYLHVSVRKRPPAGQFTCPLCGAQARSEGGDAGASWTCPGCRHTFEPCEVRIRAVPPIAKLDAGASFRREKDTLVGVIDRRLVPDAGTTFDLARHGRLHEPIERAAPFDIAFIFHLPPGDPEGSSRALGSAASYVWECGGVRIEGTESGYEIRQDGRTIPLADYPLPVWRFAFRLEE